MGDGIVLANFGPDLMYQDAYRVVLQFLPMRSLMTREDEGLRTLVGLEIEIGARRNRLRKMEHGYAPWKPYLRLHSDAAEIAERRALSPRAKGEGG